jgi:hypothetical protein
LEPIGGSSSRASVSVEVVEEEMEEEAGPLTGGAAPS